MTMRWLHGRKVCLAVGMAVALASGSQYAFGGYEGDLKKRWGWSQGQVQAVGTTLTWGTYLGHLPSGWFIDRYGPRSASALAALLCAAGYSAAAAVAASARPPERPGGGTQSVVPLAVSLFLMGVGSGLGYMSALKSNTGRWSVGARGRVIGVLAACFGLSATAVTGLFSVITSGQPEGANVPGFFAAMAGVLCVTYAVGAAATPARQEAVARYLAVVDAAFGREMDAGDRGDEARRPDEARHRGDPEGAAAEDGGDECAAPGTEQRDCASQPESPPGRGAAGPATPLIAALAALLRSRSYLVLATCFFLCGGAGLMLIYNAATVAESGGSPDGALPLVVTLSVSSTAGRLLCGALADACPRLRPLSLTLAGALMSASFTAAAVANRAGPALFAAAAGVGIAYGALWAAVPTLLTDRWGLTDFGKHFGISAWWPAFGMFVFNSLTAVWYDRWGAGSYRVPFAGSAVACALAAAVGLAF
eukprot:TRINITY_DN50243_c0_g1_i1.p1 TRINITY_DN50243_c0_g1~~TRINITY_DN50243_c0_g1_i1.p1  ORF type:complete len:478 (+),score=125.57 TRINITY_DN50243_c0_g1_i1:116-1549(+)